MLPASLSKADFHLLYVFATVAEAGGFSAAQIELNVSASTISRQIADLEFRLDMQLCQRGRSGFRLTEKGELVYQAAQKLFASVQDFSDTVDGSRERLIGQIHLAVIDNWVFNEQSSFAWALSQFVKIAPDVKLELFTLAPGDIEMAVLDGRVSLGLGVFHQNRPGLDYRSIEMERIGLYCGIGHPLFNEQDPKKTQKLLKTSQYAKRAYLRERVVAPISRSLPTKARAHQIEGIAHLILTGVYIGYLPEHFAAVWVATGRMRSVAGGKYDQPSEIKLVKKRGTSLNLAGETFERLVLEKVSQP